MIYCLSCEKYPKDTKVIPNGSTFPIDTFKVKLISNELPSTMPRTGADVEGLANDAKFAEFSNSLILDILFLLLCIISLIYSRISEL